MEAIFKQVNMESNGNSVAELHQMWNARISLGAKHCDAYLESAPERLRLDGLEFQASRGNLARLSHETKNIFDNPSHEERASDWWKSLSSVYQEQLSYKLLFKYKEGKSG